jgi:RND superfamily putative drug exporter
VLLAWLVVVIGLGAFAPQVMSKLAGAGWQDSGSQSVAARSVIERDFAGMGSTALQVVVQDRQRPIAQDPAAQRVIAGAAGLLRADRRVSTVVLPQAGLSLSRDGRTAVIQAGAAADPNTMVRAADDLLKPLQRLATPDVSVALTGSSAMWSSFNSANHAAMMKSEVLSWPVTMLVLVLAFGSLVAAGLPLMLTLIGLLAAAGSLVLATHIAPVSIWALNFAMMFALALGIDYALFLVVRFRTALARRKDEDPQAAAVAAVSETMATAGKAVLFSGITVIAALSSVLIVPSPAFRSMAIGIMLAVIFVLAATLTLLPAVLGRLGTRIDAGKIKLPGHQRRTDQVAAGEGRLHRWAHLLWRRPIAAAALALAVLAVLIVPLFGLRTGMPSITVIPASESARVGYTQVVGAFGPGAPGTLQVLVPAAEQQQAAAVLGHDAGVAAVLPGATSNGRTMNLVIPTSDASAPATGTTIDRLRSEMPGGTLIGGAAAENHDLQKALGSKTPIVFALLLGMGFLLLLIALGSPLVAFLGVAMNALSVAAAFGVAKLIFQDGHGAGLLGFTSQGFVDAWGPIFFGAMVSGVAMDYTLFLLSSAKEHYETSADPKHAMVSAVTFSGRVVVAAAMIMVAVFLTFALSGPLAPKEMGVILAVAVFLDAMLVRMLLLPVVLRVAGHGAWHSPAWLRRILPTVHFSH